MKELDIKDAPYHYPKPKRPAPVANAMRTHTATMLFRLPPDLKEDFERACHARGFLAPTVMRGMMQKFIDKCRADGVQ
jgi:hypothetical protein